ncbi:hypothetical protein ACFWMP_14175 [Paenibacillus sp. NPDC058367]|uniref:hypothetical protein n=1 Tax=unclassified Paenibacillus TaxID=185978 RepID=UPI0030F588BC
MGICAIPNCKAVADHTWALVSVCELHQEEIRAEALKYYKKRITYQGREIYLQIAPLIPWSNKE